MFETIQQISKIPAVNGSEYKLSVFLKEFFSQKGFSVKTFPGNHILIQKGNCSPKTVIFTAMDTPGFIALYKENDDVFLTPSAKSISTLKDIAFVTDINENRLKVHESKYDKKGFSIQSSSHALGSTFSISDTPNFNRENNLIFGRCTSRFACIAVLMKLMDKLNRNDVAVCFTGGFHSVTNAETNILNHVKAENAILLGTSSLPECKDHPILAVKDGKHFSSVKLSNSLINCCMENETYIQKVIFDESVTASERVFSASCKEVLSLVLPCENQLNENETISMEMIEKTLLILSVFSNSNLL